MLQKLIDELKAKLVSYDIQRVKAISEVELEELSDLTSRILELRYTLNLIQSKLPDFEDAIKEAFNDGRLTDILTAQDYYNKNYKNESRT